MQEHCKQASAASWAGCGVWRDRRCASEIAKKIRLAGLSDVYGAFGAVNVQGEQQQKLDVFANEVLIERLGALPGVAAVVSEEDDGPVVFDHAGAEFVVIFDPLDGSSNIDVNVNVGTIFSVVRTSGDVTAAALAVGTEQVAAGYVVYGPSCVLVIQTTGAGVSAFTLDDEGAFVLSGGDDEDARAGAVLLDQRGECGELAGGVSGVSGDADAKAGWAARPIARGTSAAWWRTSIGRC